MRPLWSGEAFDVAQLGYSTPDGGRRVTEVVETRTAEVACLVTDHDRRVALALTFGPGTNSRGWSVPTTWVGDGEDHFNAAERAIRDTLGWSVHTVRPIWRVARWPDRSDLVTTIVAARARLAQWRQHADVEAVDWFTRTEALGLLRAGHGFDAVTIAVLYWWLAEGSER